MRFLCLYRSGTPESTTPPSAEEMAAMGQLVGDMAKAGVLLCAEGVLPSSHGTRVTVESGELRVVDGPFADTPHLVSGFCMLQTKTRAEAIEWTKRFLSLVKHGTSEVRQLHDTPAG